jgi:hypothetical protein
MTFTAIMAFLFSVLIVIIVIINKKVSCANTSTGKKYKRVFIVVLVNKKKYVVMTRRLKIPNCLMKKGENVECGAQRAFNEICGFALDDFTRIGYLSCGHNVVLIGKTNNIIYDDTLNIHLVSIDDIIFATSKTPPETVSNIKNKNIFRILNETTCNFTNFTFDTYTPSYSYINYTP